jgi:hypothetical protein
LLIPLFVTNESLLMISIYLEVEHYRHRTSWSTAFCSFAWSRWRLVPWRRSCRSSSRSRRTSPECRRSTRSRRCSNTESRFGRSTLSVGPDHRFIHNNYVNQIAKHFCEGTCFLTLTIPSFFEIKVLQSLDILFFIPR